jgi:ABC-2 type transport system permease protein
VPIHDQSYRRYGGTRQPAQRAWLVIARAGIKTYLKRRVLMSFLFGAWIPVIVRLIGFYVSENFAQTQAFLGPSASVFRQVMAEQNFFVFVIAVYVGSGLIALDRKANALQIYLSKPLTRLDYVAGKMTVLAAFLLFVTFAPTMFLLIGQILLSGSFDFFRANITLLPSITLFAAVEIFVVCCAVLALSSLTTSTRYVAVMFAGVMFFSEAVYGTLHMVTGSTAVSWVSFTGSLAQIGDVIFRVEPRYQTPAAVSFIVIAALTAVSLSVLERRVRGVEVVA